MEQKMDVQLRCSDKVIQLINKGVEIQNPITIDLGEEVNVDNIMREGQII